jgi:hypothetical protein
MEHRPSGWCSSDEFHGNVSPYRYSPARYTMLRLSIVSITTARMELRYSPTVSPQSAKRVGPGNVPLTSRTFRETPSGAAVVLTSSR